MSSKLKRSILAFTLVEIMMVVTLIGILSAIVINNVSGSKERTYRTEAFAEMNTLANATRLYLEKYNEYPDDVDRDIPAALSEFIAIETDWPDAAWPGSVFDYDNWMVGGEHIVQISIRFCPISGPIEDCQFPDEPWAENFDVQSAVYYCMKGPCRAHSSKPYNHPGYCINCTVQPSET